LKDQDFEPDLTEWQCANVVSTDRDASK
jgi:hypothetical protein